MGVTITAVPAAGVEPLTPPTNTDRDLQDFAASLRMSPMGGLPQAANPATLVGEVFGGLKGYFERAQGFEKRLTSHQTAAHGGAGVAVASLAETPVAGGTLAGAEGGDGDGLSEFGKVGLAELERAQELAVQSQFFLTETSVVTHAAGSIPHSINTLLKGQ